MKEPLDSCTRSLRKFTGTGPVALETSVFTDFSLRLILSRPRELSATKSSELFLELNCMPSGRPHSLSALAEPARDKGHSGNLAALVTGAKITSHLDHNLAGLCLSLARW